MAKDLHPSLLSVLGNAVEIQNHQADTLRSLDQARTMTSTMSYMLADSLALVNQTVKLVRQTLEAPRRQWSIFTPGLVSGESYAMLKSDIVDNQQFPSSHSPLYVAKKASSALRGRSASTSFY